MEEEYSIVENGDDKFHHIKLNKKPYKDIVFQFGSVKLIEENECLRVKFEFEVFQNLDEVDTTTRAFNDYIGRILIENLSTELLLSTSHRQRMKDQDE